MAKEDKNKKESSLEWYNRVVEREYSTSGHKKFVRYLAEVLETKEYEELIKYLRAKYHIPESGFSSKEGLIFPVRNWKVTKQEEVNFKKEIKKFCEKYHLHYMDTSDIIRTHLFYNEKFDPKNLLYELGRFNLCLISDLVMEAEEPFGKDFQDSDNMAYPIAIRISPYASLRDILDFVKATYTNTIKQIQENYRNKEIKLGSLKKRKEKIKERNNFIYESKHLPRKKIMELVYGKYGENANIDYAYIGKIISLEKKKRKEL